MGPGLTLLYDRHHIMRNGQPVAEIPTGSVSVTFEANELAAELKTWPVVRQETTLVSELKVHL